MGLEEKKYPKISIITPSYNQGHYLEETILSIIGQNYPNLEYIIIDGGSKDNSVEIIKKYEKYLTYWTSEPDRGHGHALNKGFHRSTGEIMAWINSDDKYHPDAFKKVAEIFDQFKDVNWIVGKNSWWDDTGKMTSQKYIFKNIFDFLRGNYDWIQQESVFWRRSLWDKTGGKINENYRFMVDGELWCRFFLKDKLYHVDLLLSGYRSYGVNRAALNMDICNAEMRKAIHVMKRSWNEKILRDSYYRKSVNFLRKRLSFSSMIMNNDSYFDYDAITYSPLSHEWIKVKRDYF